MRAVPSARDAAAIVAALVAIRLAIAAVTPLTFDEAYYWTWSKYLAGGYYDHPPMVALVIRLGTLVAGDTEFGVRLASVLLALPMSFALYRAAEMLFGDARIAAWSAILLNASLMVAGGTTIVTPDAPLLAASCFVLFALAKVIVTGNGAWWLGVGVAIGVSLLSKYSGLFLGAAVAFWIVATPEARRWLGTPWPYAAAVIALAMFAPVIVWNAQHEWASFIKQFGRARGGAFRLTYLAEMLPAQFFLATPTVFVLGAMGLVALARPDAGSRSARVLIGATIGVVAGYFVWHSTHDRVEANWLAPAYPAFAIAGALAVVHGGWSSRTRRIAAGCARASAPFGAALLILAAVQANTGIFTGYKRDPTVRSVGVGYREMVRDIDAMRLRIGATCVFVDDYGNAGWLSFYLPKGTCVAQRTQRLRWVNFPDPDAAALAGPLLLVGEDNAAQLPYLQSAFARIEKVGQVERRRGPLVIETVELDRLDGPVGDAFDRTLPPR